GPRGHDRRHPDARRRLVAGIASIELLVDHSYRAAAIRLVAAAVLLVAVSRIRAFVRAAVEWPSAWEERAGETGWGPPTHGQFEHFQDRKSTRLNSSHDQNSYAV